MTAIIKDSHVATQHTVDRFSRKEGARKKEGKRSSREVERTSDLIGISAYPRQCYGRLHFEKRRMFRRSSEAFAVRYVEIDMYATEKNSPSSENSRKIHFLSVSNNMRIIRNCALRYDVLARTRHTALRHSCIGN